MTKEELKEKAHQLSSLPGVYIMKDKVGEIIYIGKAKSLKNRVSQYFAELASHTLKTRRMVERISDFETIFAKTEFDAFLLENTLIKKHKPKYNILLKDDKGYPFIHLGVEEYPRFSITSKRESKGRNFGPFGGRGTANGAIKLLTEAFMLPNCSRKFPRDIGKERPCLRNHLGKCIGVCTGQISPEEYDGIIGNAILVLDGKGEMLEKELTIEMQQAAEILEFERAAKLRNMITSVQKLRQNKIVMLGTNAERDVLAYCVEGVRACITRLSYFDGNLVDKTTIFFEGLDKEDEKDALTSFIKQFYGAVTSVPKEILVSEDLEDIDALEEYLTRIRESKCTLTSPKRGDKVRLIELAKENGKLELFQKEISEQRSSKTLELLTSALRLEDIPNRIEACDISNTAGDEAVASLTVFENGKPKKSAYKRYKIKSATGGDDYGAISEVIGRRIDRALAGDKTFLPLPDLLLIDGGKGQVNVARQALLLRKIDIPICGMVKDDRHRTRGLISCDGDEIGIAATPSVFSFIGRIQEETHRFAVNYHQQRRGKQMRHSVLDSIPGVGPSRKKALISHFGSAKSVATATLEELEQVIPTNVAQEVKKFFEEKVK